MGKFLTLLGKERIWQQYTGITPALYAAGFMQEGPDCLGRQVRMKGAAAVHVGINLAQNTLSVDTKNRRSGGMYHIPKDIRDAGALFTWMDEKLEKWL